MSPVPGADGRHKVHGNATERVRENYEDAARGDNLQRRRGPRSPLGQRTEVDELGRLRLVRPRPRQSPRRPMQHPRGTP